jgi:hypothetical protein
MCVGYRDESSGGAGRAQAPPTAENPLKPLLSLPYKFEEEGGRKEELKEGEGGGGGGGGGGRGGGGAGGGGGGGGGEKSPPPPPLKLILDPSLMGYFITTKKCLPLRK